jgi:hypothetical protein
MIAGPPLPPDLWDCLPPEARALIQALRAEVQALQQQVRDLRERLNENSTNSSRPPSADPPSVNVDETGWRQGRKRAWLWIAVTRAVTVFTVALSRAGSVARGLIDPAAGQVITTDRYSGYRWLPLRQRQVCWAHLVRDFQAMVDRASAGSPIGEELLCVPVRRNTSLTGTVSWLVVLDRRPSHAACCRSCPTSPLAAALKAFCTQRAVRRRFLLPRGRLPRRVLRLAAPASLRGLALRYCPAPLPSCAPGFCATACPRGVSPALWLCPPSHPGL